MLGVTSSGPRMSEQQKKLLNVDQVAEWLSCSPQCVYDMASKGVLPSVRVGTGRGLLRFDPDDVESFIDSARTAGRRRVRHVHGREARTA